MRRRWRTRLRWGSSKEADCGVGSWDMLMRMGLTLWLARQMGGPGQQHHHGPSGWESLWTARGTGEPDSTSSLFFSSAGRLLRWKLQHSSSPSPPKKNKDCESGIHTERKMLVPTQLTVQDSRHKVLKGPHLSARSHRILEQQGLLEGSSGTISPTNFQTGFCTAVRTTVHKGDVDGTKTTLLFHASHIEVPRKDVFQIKGSLPRLRPLTIQHPPSSAEAHQTLHSRFGHRHWFYNDSVNVYISWTASQD